MLQVKVIREDKRRIVNALRKRNWSAVQLRVLDQILAADDRRRSTQRQLDESLAEQNRLSKQIGQMMAQGKKDEAESLKAQVSALKEHSKALEEQQRHTEQELDTLLLSVPNAPHKSVPKGKTADDNKEIGRASCRERV